MTGQPPDGWQEVFRGACLEADLVLAVLEANGLRPVRQQLSPQVWWSGPVAEDCRVYVPYDEVESARQALEEREPDPSETDETDEPQA